MSRMAGDVVGTTGDRLVRAAVLLLVAVQIVLFSSGYRLSADDAGLTMSYLEGWDSTWAYAQGAAEQHGRIGMYVVGPMNAIASYWSSSFAVRVLFAALHFLVLLLFARLAGRWFGNDTGGVLAIVLVAVHPLAFEHMPPNAYGLQNTVPFLILLVARVYCLRPPLAGEGPHPIRVWLGRGMFVAGLLFSEYAFLFGFALVAMECWLTLLGSGGRMWSMAGVRDAARRQVADVSMLAAALAIYALYRWSHPSHYDGNVPDGVAHAWRWAETSVRHVLAGTMLVRLDSSVLRLPAVALAIGLVAAVTGGLAVRRLLPAETGPHATLASAGMALLLSLLVVMPVASTVKQQEWCVDGGVCGFLDSRMAYPWLILACVLVLHWLLRAAAAREWARPASRVASLVVAFAVLITFAYNWRQAGWMREASAPWQRADALACQPASNKGVRSLIDPGGAIVMHPNVDPESYWRDYLKRQADRPACAMRTD
ncbi:hypothetical protein J2X02_001023 [Pseudoxanthomonas japonensis]|uniref:hypothetical protein n=1 Tax=Pseudoxanthomonas japonensis TaxID=69284 RepID=UPI0028569981|nr:hypothetical protein [Pseudoxanthomonas japonensis]MDR7068206.1 hypothetical protein [Pseudoxanthomonas japonensis]